MDKRYWTASRKAELLDAISAGKLTEEEASTLHATSPEELAAWRRDRAHGAASGLGDVAISQKVSMARRRAERQVQFRYPDEAA